MLTGIKDDVHREKDGKDDDSDPIMAMMTMVWRTVTTRKRMKEDINW